MPNKNKHDFILKYIDGTVFNLFLQGKLKNKISLYMSI